MKNINIKTNKKRRLTSSDNTTPGLPKALRRKGFTIVELLIVIVVIGILAAISLVTYNGIQGRASQSVRDIEIKQFIKQLDLHKAEYGEYPDPDPLALNNHNAMSPNIGYVANPTRLSENERTPNAAHQNFIDRTAIRLPKGVIYQKVRNGYYLIARFPTVDSIPAENRSNKHYGSNSAFPQFVTDVLSRCGSASYSELAGRVNLNAPQSTGGVGSGAFGAGFRQSSTVYWTLNSSSYTLEDGCRIAVPRDLSTPDNPVGMYVLQHQS